jgi:hypothetical protein
MKEYTYNPRWTMDDIVTSTEYADKKASTEAWTHGAVFGHTHLGNHEEKWRLTPDLPFWWFLNPWKTVEHLQDSLRTANAEANEWHEKHQQEAKVVKSLSDQIYDLQNELDTVKAERDAANEAVRHLRKKRKR